MTSGRYEAHVCLTQNALGVSKKKKKYQHLLQLPNPNNMSDGTISYSLLFRNWIPLYRQRNSPDNLTPSVILSRHTHFSDNENKNLYYTFFMSLFLVRPAYTRRIALTSTL